MNSRQDVSLLLATVAALASLTSVAHGAQACPPPRLVAAPVPYTMTEQAYDGNCAVNPNRIVPVDANSTLVVAFKVPVAESDLGANPEWQRVNALLASTTQMTAERARLEAAQVDLGNPAAVSAFLGEIRSFDKRAKQLYQTMQDAGLATSDIATILSGRFDNQPNAKLPYVNLARWLKLEIERLRRNAAAFSKNKEELEVTVQAFLEPVAGKTKGLHIDGYDDIPAGELRPIDRFGVSLTPGERQQLAAELAVSNAAAAMIGEIQENSQTIKDDFRKLLADLQTQAAALEQNLGSGPTSWSAQLGSAIAQLKQLAGAPGASASFAGSANALAKDLTDFQTDLNSIATAAAAAKTLRTTLQRVSGLDLQTLLLGADGLANKLAQLEQHLETLAKNAQKWPARLDSARQHLDEVASAIPVSLVPKLLPTDVQTFFSDVSEHLPKTVEGLTIAVEILRGPSLDLAGAGDTLATTAGTPIAHALDDLPDARVELARSGLALGDHVTVKIRFQKKTTLAAVQKPKVVYEQLYVTEATLIGVHRTIGGELIFARGVSGSDSAKKWKPNAAALVNWHYTKRSPTGFWKGWNFVDPGLGIHLASLDQGEEAVEVGAGVNLTLLQGLVSAGYGYNLTVTKDRDYFLLGINLLKVLTEARGLAPGGSGL